MRSGLLRRCGLAAPLFALLIALLVGPAVAAHAASTSAGAAAPSPVPSAAVSGSASAASPSAVASAATAPSAAASAAADLSAGFVLPFTFNETPYTVVDLPPLLQPLSASTAARVDTGVHDSQGVRMRLIDGVLYNYPGAAASYGLANIDTYRDTAEKHSTCCAPRRRLSG